MKQKVDIKSLDSYLRLKLKISDLVSIEIHSSKEPDWGNRLRSEKTAGTYLYSADRPLNVFYVVYRDGLTTKELIKTISHEYVHIAQVSSGRWVKNESFQIWEGKIIKLNNKEIVSDKYSHITPWEKEAYRLEKELYQEYISFSEMGFFQSFITRLKLQIA